MSSKQQPDKQTPESSQKGRLHQEYYRNGAQHRDGADVSFHDIVKYFGFRAVTIGRWVTAKEQQIAANLFFDALCDLMDILRVPQSVISLNFTLALAFGHGGNRGAKAHYNSSTKTFSLAKNAGGGALAHEWFHAFDHYISHRMFTIQKSGCFASEVWLNETATMIEHPLNEQLSKFFTTVFLTPNSSTPSQLFTASANADAKFGSFYYARPQEMCARAFEAVVQQSSIKNSFLVAGTMKSREAEIGLYPRGDLATQLQSEIFQYFHQLGSALKHQAKR